MILKNVPLTLLKVQLKEGIGKTSNKPYKFYTANVVDEEANVFQLNLGDAVTQKEIDELLELKNAKVLATVEFKPKGFDVGGTLVAVEVE